MFSFRRATFGKLSFFSFRILIGHLLNWCAYVCPLVRLNSHLLRCFFRRQLACFFVLEAEGSASDFFFLVTLFFSIRLPVKFSLLNQERTQVPQSVPLSFFQRREKNAPDPRQKRDVWAILSADAPSTIDNLHRLFFLSFPLCPSPSSLSVLRGVRSLRSQVFFLVLGCGVPL